MKAAFGLVALAIIVIVAFIALDPSYQRMRDDQARYEASKQSIDLQYRALELQERQQLSSVNVASSGALQVIMVFGALGVLVALGDWYYNRRQPLVHANSSGLYPVARQHLIEGDMYDLIFRAVEDYHQTQALRAIHQPGQTPAHLTYSPHTSRTALDVRDEDAPEQVASITVPAFGDLLNSGRVGRGHPLLLAYDLEDGKPLEGSWLDLYSTAIAGLPGTGKTTSQRFFACQTALHGARFVVVDPHAEAGEDSLATTLQPLSNTYMCEPASDDKAILNAVKLVASIGEKRAKQGDRDRTPVIIWIDELTALLARSSVREPLAELLEQIAQEYRKVAVYATASGQIWTASRTGDSSALRDSFASALVHRMKRGQARMLLPSEDAQRVERLEPGRAMLWRTNGASTLVAIPNTTGADVRRVAELLDNQAMNSAPETIIDQPAVSRVSSRNHPARSASGSQTAETARIITLFLEGLDAGEIVTELTSMKSRAGAPYQKKLREVQAVIRGAMKGE